MASRTENGLSVVEIVVALGVLGLAAVTVLSVCSSVLKYRRQSTNALNAARVTDMIMERTVASLAADSPTGTRDAFWAGSYPYPGSAYQENTLKVGGLEYSYAVYADDVPGLGDPGADPPNLLRRIDVYVWWEDMDVAGRRKTVATRLINSGEEP